MRVVKIAVSAEYEKSIAAYIRDANMFPDMAVQKISRTKKEIVLVVCAADDIAIKRAIRGTRLYFEVRRVEKIK